MSESFDDTHSANLSTLTVQDKFEIRVKDTLFGAPVPRWVYRTLWRGGDPVVAQFHEHHAIFVHIPKTAGSSVANALFGSQVGHRPIRRHLAYHPVLVRSYFKFAFVRNPWDRLHSAYKYFANSVGSRAHRDHRWANEHIAPFGSFLEFVSALDRPSFAKRVRRYSHFRDQLDWVVDPRTGEVALDFIGRFESLAEDFAEICRRLEVDVALPHRRPSGGGDYRSEYDAHSIEIIRKVYVRDIDAFGYDFADY